MIHVCVCVCVCVCVSTQECVSRPQIATREPRILECKCQRLTDKMLLDRHSKTAVLLDFGLVKHVDTATRVHFAKLLVAAVRFCARTHTKQKKRRP